MAVSGDCYLSKELKVGQIQYPKCIAIIYQEENQSHVGGKPQRGQGLSDICDFRT